MAGHKALNLVMEVRPFPPEPEMIMRKDIPQEVREEVCKWHYAGKKHSNICKLIKRKFFLEITEGDVYDIAFKSLKELMKVEKNENEESVETAP